MLHHPCWLENLPAQASARAGAAQQLRFPCFRHVCAGVSGVRLQYVSPSSLTCRDLNAGSCCAPVGSGSRALASMRVPRFQTGPVGEVRVAMSDAYAGFSPPPMESRLEIPQAVPTRPSFLIESNACLIESNACGLDHLVSLSFKLFRHRVSSNVAKESHFARRSSQLAITT
jgi:hypothetical protein